MEMKLQYGTTYYQITYADPKLTMPGLKPMVYIGKNILGNEPEDTHYFQDTISILIFGLLSEAKDTSECKISSCLEKEIDTDILTLDGAIDELQKASKKSKKLGYPKLQKANGNWK